ncbi:MAG TPA: type II toxin-antitoxin system Phd/YefM family antitoxin [Solirubrobacteraceae bacterium]|nr:type II toxin-antitoxin system Phd/YefM family antitoxin [Solirubrobacteraceae bacterium]
MSSMTVSEARAALREVLERVQVGEEVTITRHGQPVAVVVRPDLLRIRRAAGALASTAQAADLLSAGRPSPLPTASGLSHERAEELVAAVRNARGPTTSATFPEHPGGPGQLPRRAAH